MKTIFKTLSVFALALSVQSHANTFQLNDDDGEVSQKCSGLEIEGDVLSCTMEKDFSKVNTAKVGAKYMGPGLDVIGENDLDVIFDLGIMPDGDTNGIYNFVRKLVDAASGKQVGYIVYEGFENSEMEVRLQVVKRFNMVGRMVSVTVEDR